MAEERKQLILKNLQTQALAEVRGFEKGLLNTKKQTVDLTPVFACTPCVRNNHFCYSPDGKYMAFVWGAQIFFWDRRERRWFHVYENDSSISSVNIGPDGKMIIMRCNGSDIKAWNMESGKTHYHLSHEFCWHILISLDGKFLVYSEYKDRHTTGTTVVRRISDGKLVHIIDRKVFKMAIGPDNNLITYDNNNGIEIWDLITGQKTGELKVPEDWYLIESFKVSPDGSNLVMTIKNKRCVYFMDLETGRTWTSNEEKSTNGNYNLDSMDISPDGRVIATTSGGDGIWLWDVESGWVFHRIKGFWHDVIFSPDGSELFAQDDDFQNYEMEYSIWDSKNGQQIYTLPTGLKSIYATDFWNENNTMVLACRFNIIKFFSMESGEMKIRRIEGQGLQQINLSKKLKILAVGEYNRIHIFDMDTFNEIAVWNNQKTISKLKILDERNELACVEDKYMKPSLPSLILNGPEYSIVYFHDLNNGEIVREINCHSVVDTIFLKELGQKMVTIDKSRREIRTWDIDNEVCESIVKIGEVFSAGIKNIFLNYDHTICLTISSDGSIRLWDMQTGSYLRSLESTNSVITLMEFHPDGKTFIMAEKKGQLSKWDLQTGKLLQDFGNKEGDKKRESLGRELEQLVISKDGKLIYSIFQNGTIDILDYFSGEKLATYYNLKEGFLLGTPPDEYAKNGWIYTNRPDLVPMHVQDENGSEKIVYLPVTDERVINYMKEFNDRDMVINRIFKHEKYEKLLQDRIGAKSQTQFRLDISREKSAIKLLGNPDCRRESF